MCLSFESLFRGKNIFTLFVDCELNILVSTLFTFIRIGPEIIVFKNQTPTTYFQHLLMTNRSPEHGESKVNIL